MGNTFYRLRRNILGPTNLCSYTCSTQHAATSEAVIGWYLKGRTMRTPGVACLLVEQLSKTQNNIIGLQEVRWYENIFIRCRSFLC